MKSIARYAPMTARILFGLLFLVFGLNGFLHFIPQPPPPEHAMGFIGGLASTGYMFPLIKGVEVIVAILLLVNRFVPLALALIAPNVVNIVLFHVVLEPSGIPMALAILVVELYLAWSYRDAYRSMLAARAAPTASATTPPEAHLHAHAHRAEI
jgi:uncharacterized membrane protein YphA (DoxX/SURF4 family)